MKQPNVAPLTDKLFMRMFITSILIIVLCMVGIAVTSFALFADTLENNGNYIKTAVYDVSVTDVEAEDGEISAKDGRYSCVAGKTYTVTLTAEGDAENGYAIVILSPTEIYYSDIIAPGETLTFTVTRDTDFSFSVRGHWGRYEEFSIKNGDSI